MVRTSPGSNPTGPNNRIRPGLSTPAAKRKESPYRSAGSPARPGPSTRALLAISTAAPTRAPRAPIAAVPLQSLRRAPTSNPQPVTTAVPRAAAARPNAPVAVPDPNPPERANAAPNTASDPPQSASALNTGSAVSRTPATATTTAATTGHPGRQ